MKKMLFILLFPLACLSQQLKENHIDEFTKKHIKRTDYETLKSTQYLALHYRVSKIDDESFFEIKMVLSPRDYFSIQQGDKLMFKASDGQVLELESISTMSSCIGCGAIGLIGSKAQGLKSAYLLTTETKKFLTDKVIDKIRIYTSLGYQDIDVKENKYLKLKKSIALTD